MSDQSDRRVEVRKKPESPIETHLDFSETGVRELRKKPEHSLTSMLARKSVLEEQVTIENFSTKGFQVRCKIYLEVGDTIYLWFLVPTKNNEQENCIAECIVRWQDCQEEFRGGSYQVVPKKKNKTTKVCITGVEIANIFPEHARLLAEYYESLQAPIH